MAKLGTKKRPAIVRVQTESRAKEVASIFAEHGWQFILGIEPGKPENVSDLTRLLNSPQSQKAKKLNGQIASEKARKSHSRRKNSLPLSVVCSGDKRTKSSEDTIKAIEEKCEYAPKTNTAKLHAIISCALSAFFLVKFLTTTSLWYVILLVLPFLYFLGLLNALFLNQTVVLHGTKITILRRRHTPITANIADSLYQIVVKKGVMFSFRFLFHNEREVAQITPSVYKDGDQLLQQLTAIINQEKIVVDRVEK